MQFQVKMTDQKTKEKKKNEKVAVQVTTQIVAPVLLPGTLSHISIQQRGLYIFPLGLRASKEYAHRPARWAEDSWHSSLTA